MTRHDLPDDELMQRLSEVLHSEAAQHQPSSDSLGLIRERVPVADGRTAWRWAAPLAVAAALVAGVAATAVLKPGGDQVAGVPPIASVIPSLAPSPGPSTSLSPSPSTTTGPSPSATSTIRSTPAATVSQNTNQGQCLGGPATVPVYFSSDVPNVGPRLYREFTSVGGCDVLTAALTKVFVSTPRDPDYFSLWPSDTTVLSVTREGNIATIDLSSFVEVGAAFESSAVQQIVWTATAVDKSISRVRLRVNGETPPSGHSDWSQPLARDNALFTLANVWILQPAQGAEVGSPVTIRVYGTGFEGQVPLKVFEAGVEVASTSVTTRMGGFAEASTTITLPPGSYEVRAYNDNGQDESLQLWDSKTFAVR